MDLFLKKNINYLLKKYQTRPSKGFGQNFLIDKGVIRKIISTAQLMPEDTVLEIGPGLGSLTQELAKRVKTVISVEKDGRMVDILKETLRDCKNVKIIQGDILKIFNFLPLKAGLNYKVVANLPFYITAPVIRLFLELTEARPRSMVLMAQKEVAQRICAQPPDMNLLAVSVQFYVHPHTKQGYGVGAGPKIVSYVSKKSFWPQPKVDAAILRIAPLINTDKKRVNTDLFFKIVKAGFSHPRKQIGNNLSKELALNQLDGLKLEKEKISSWLRKNNIQPTQRAETLSINDWIGLTKSYSQ
ncbi:MAG: 16S rRNA (adenine(1518)-N(6)/adenine(1519)-N(6))-dimethyltransferase RsmA [bacterium]|nr:16S rRNA (adenine(1518)-N(6)/adenine(1519)-N(6))-dimethyltransferase RsmA [bacterium]